MRIALVLLVWCNQSSPPPNAPPPPPRTKHAPRAVCTEEWFVLRAVHECPDLRGGRSGFWVLEIVDGPHAGESVIASYADMPVLVGPQPAPNRVSEWNIASAITFEPITPTSSWGNRCLMAGGGTSYDAHADGVEGFADETAARTALAARCPR